MLFLLILTIALASFCNGALLVITIYEAEEHSKPFYKAWKDIIHESEFNIINKVWMWIINCIPTILALISLLCAVIKKHKSEKTQKC